MVGNEFFTIWRPVAVIEAFPPSKNTLELKTAPKILRNQSFIFPAKKSNLGIVGFGATELTYFWEKQWQ